MLEKLKSLISKKVEYAKRLSKYCNLNIIELPDKTIPEKLNQSVEEQIKNFESEEIISHIPKDSYKICLDLSRKELLIS